MQKIILISLITLLLCGCGLKSFPNMSIDNPVQVYSEEVLTNNVVDNNKIVSIINKHDDIINVFKEIYNDNVSIKKHYDKYETYRVAIPRYANSDINKILQTYCEIKTNNNYTTKMYGIDRNIKAENFCKEKFDEQNATTSMSNLFYYYEDINKLAGNAVPAGEWDREKNIKIVGASTGLSETVYSVKEKQDDYNYYAFFTDTNLIKNKLYHVFMKEKSIMNRRIKTINSFQGKSEKLDVVMSFVENKPYRINITVKNKNKTVLQLNIDNFIGAISINNKRYDYVYNYRHNMSYCPYSKDDNSILLLPSGECYFEVNIDKLQDNFPYEFSDIKYMEYLSNYQKLKLDKVTDWDIYNNNMPKDFNLFQ